MKSGTGMKARLRMVFITLVTLGLSATAFTADASLLKPPPGAKVAIVMFEDLQCPDCSRAYTMVMEEASAHKIPVVLHALPSTMHTWPFEGAGWAPYLDKTPPNLGNQFRKF